MLPPVWPKLITTSGPSQEDTEAAKQAGITLLAHSPFCEALKQSLLEHVQKCLQAARKDDSAKTRSLLTSRYYVFGGTKFTQILVNQLHLSFPGFLDSSSKALKAHDSDLYCAESVFDTPAVQFLFNLQPARHAKITDSKTLETSNLEEPVNLIGGTNLELENLVSHFDINCGMGGASFELNDSGQLLLQKLFISPHLWFFLLGSEHSTKLTLRIINWRTPAESVIRLLDKIVDQPFLTADIGEAGHAATRVLAADAGVVHKSCHIKALPLLSWADSPIFNLSLIPAVGVWGAWKFAR